MYVLLHHTSSLECEPKGTRGKTDRCPKDEGSESLITGTLRGEGSEVTSVLVRDPDGDSSAVTPLQSSIGRILH